MSNTDGIKMEDLLKSAGERSESTAKASKEKVALAPKRSKRPKKVWKIIAVIAVALVVLGSVGWGIYSYMELEKVRNPEFAEQQAEQENQALLNKVGKLMELPDGEAVVATVSDKTKLEDQPFFAKAENGDKVLIFSESSMAIIYRESTDKIINSGPIAITSSDSLTAE